MRILNLFHPSRPFAKDRKKEYKEWSENTHAVPIFLQWWWIEAATNGKWNAVFSHNKDGSVRAVWPYTVERKFGFYISRMPKQTQFLGPWISQASSTRAAKKIAHEKEALENLIDQIPNFSFFKQKFRFSLKNWMPFYWRGYAQTTLYTYRLDLSLTIENLHRELESNIKTDIKKAQSKVFVKEINDIDAFYEINKKSFLRQKKNIPYSLDFVRGLDKELSQRKMRRITLAIDTETQEVHAAVYIVWDTETAYYLWGGADPSLRSSGATSLLLWDAIEYCQKFAKFFDFEGSMIKPVEKFVRAFGADQVPYFEVQKRNFLFKLADLARGKIK